MPVLHSRPLAVTHHANYLSCASCCTFFYVVCLVILPYVTVYLLGGMWTKESLVREQPAARFRYEVLVEAHASAPSAPFVPLSWSTSQAVNDALGSALRPCTLKAWEEDDERDGLADKLNFVVRMPIDADAGERVHAASVIVGVDVHFHQEFQLRMNASLRFEASSPLPGVAMQQTADLVLRSNHPQRSLDLSMREPCPQPVWALREPLQPTGAATTAEAVLAQYASCNDTAVLAPQPAVWTPGVASSFEARLTLRVPPQLTTRRPGLLETLKLAAVQYIAFFFPIAFLLQCLHGALFRFGIVSSRVHHPVKQHYF